jgi:hypothetical protein
MVRCLVKELGADVNQADHEGDTPLYLAALEGKMDILRCLVREFGADVSQANSDGCTPLMIAIVNNHVDVVRWLVKEGADTQAKFAATEYTAATISKEMGAPAEQTAYLEAKTHCSSPVCSGAGLLKCTGCKQARYCGEACQLAHWKVHKADCRRWSGELEAGKGHPGK